MELSNSFKSYQDLEVWKKGMILAREIYQITNEFPDDEKFGIVNQIRRAAVSIPSNIAEGHARSSTGEFMRFISIALGSVAELETQIIISEDIGYMKDDKKIYFLDLLDTIGKMLRGLYKSLGKRK